MIRLGRNTLVLQRKHCVDINREYKPGDFLHLFDGLGFHGSFSFDNYLFSIDERSLDDCYDCVETLLSCSSIEQWHHAAILADGQFWSWGVSWLDIKYPFVSYRNPEMVDLPLIWDVEVPPF